MSSLPQLLTFDGLGKPQPAAAFDQTMNTLLVDNSARPRKPIPVTTCASTPWSPTPPKQCSETTATTPRLNTPSVGADASGACQRALARSLTTHPIRWRLADVETSAHRLDRVWRHQSTFFVLGSIRDRSGRNQDTWAEKVALPIAYDQFIGSVPG